MSRRNIIIRPISIDDLPGLFRFGNEQGGFYSIDHPWNEENLSDLLSVNMDISFIAVSRKDIAGFLIAQRFEEAAGISARIIWIAADKRLSRLDIKSQLLQHCISKLSELGIYRILTGIVIDNKSIIDIYRKFDFFDTEQVLIMERNLSKL